MAEPLLLDTHGVDNYIDALTEISGKSRKEVLQNVIGQVLDLCIQRSPGPATLGAALRQKVQLRIMKPGRFVGESGTMVAAGRAPRPIADGTLQTLTGTRGGKAGGTWYIGRLKNGRRVIVAGERMLDNKKFAARRSDRDSINSQLKGKVKPAIDRVGALKQSWVQIANRIGAPLRKVPAYLRKRAAGRYDDGARSRWEITETRQFFEIVNTNGQLIQRYNGAAILQGAIDTRLKAFEFEVRKDVFADITARAKRYPGLFTA